MRSKCENCNGTGKISKPEKCRTCNGYGSTKVSLSDISFDKDKGITPKAVGPQCPDCKGTGTINVSGYNCDQCKGSGFKYFCEICHKPTDSTKLLCRDCFNNPVVYELKQPLDFRVLESEHAILGTILSTNYEGGMKIALGAGLEGKVPGNKIPRSFNLSKGQKIPVTINTGTPDFYEARNRKAPFILTLLRINDYMVKPIRRNLRPLTIKRILNGNFENKTVVVVAQVITIRQTSGPTSFTFLDEAGDQIPGVAFVEAGVRAYPLIKEKSVVRIVSKFVYHRNAPQLDISEMELVPENELRSFKDVVNKRIEVKASIDPEFKFLISSPTLEALKPEMIKVAERIRKALLLNQPILIKYHHPCVDGAISGVILELAILGLMNKSWEENTRNIFKKIPERDPTYPVQSATRDILASLEESARYGYELPLVVLLDFGSSQSQISYELQKKGFNLDIVVIDHHVIDEGIKNMLYSHINPLYHTEEYSLSTGMLVVELARMIYPDSQFSDEIKHMSAIAGIADRIQGNEIQKYKELVKDLYSVEDLTQIVKAAKYATYNVRFSDGSLLFYEIFGVGGRKNRQKQLTTILAQKEDKLVNLALESATQNVIQENLSNGAMLAILDITKFVKKNVYPPAGKLVGFLHDSLCKNELSRVVTIGLGIDYLIYRNSNLVGLKLTGLIEYLKEKHPSAGIDGGGHDMVGTIKFLQGYQSQILESIRISVAEKAQSIQEEVLQA